jgi:Lsr2
MAKKVTTTLQDDLDGSPAAGTVHFALGGSEFEIDLSEKNARQFRRQIDPFLEHARRARKATTAARANRSAAGRKRTSGIREWAREHGMDVSERGRIPTEVIERYEAANGR